MKNLLKTVTECIDKFSKQYNLSRLAAIVGGEAVIMHGIPRTTLDIDVLCYWQTDKNDKDSIVKLLAFFLREELGESYEVNDFEASKDPFDPLKHDLLIITDTERRYKKLDILIANYKWEVEGFAYMDSPDKGPLQIYPKPYLVGMKLMAGGVRDEEDIRDLFLLMTDLEKVKALDIARLIRRDKNLSRILSEDRRGSV
ncbi:hypothetical protein PITCH_A2030185 [uncultured Desulfobacterium sp.]|uniref:Uncharacterized protein n=1 Tax=uncultured Desulfobacterium sp. TaxID=201089 RepID=A0A445MXG2_9BACT|nr:hypothetical protein PITCH_A2030185 [uncultured Desulfobacterium sp.]